MTRILSQKFTIHSLYKNIFLVALLGMMGLVQAIAQTPGLIYKPSSTTSGRSVLDPNGDGFTSASTAGFSPTDYGTNSELRMVPVPNVMSEPFGDPATGGTGGHTDVVSVDGGNSVFVLKKEVAGVEYFIVRFRLGGASTARKGYSLLIDTNLSFSSTGTNPGFEKELVLETGVGVKIYTHNVGTGTSTSKTFNLEANHQRSIALSTNNGNPDYFYDFFVPYSELEIPAGTPVRFVATTITSAQSGIGGTSSDVDGIDDRLYGGNTLAIYFDLISSFPPVDLNTLGEGGSFGSILSYIPSVTGPISVNSTSIRGYSQEANGSTIRVYQNGTLIGSTTVSNQQWTLTGFPSLTIGAFITATAQGTSKGESNSSNSIEVTGAQTCYLEAPVITTRTSGSQIIGGTWTGSIVPSGTNLQVKLFNQVDGTTFNPVATGVTVYVQPNGTWSFTTGLNQNVFNSTNFVATVTNIVSGSPVCVSTYSNVSKKESGNANDIGSVTPTPTVITNPILASTGARDIVVSNNGVSAVAAFLKLYVNGAEVAITPSTVAANASYTFSRSGLIEGDIIMARAQGTGTAPNYWLSNQSTQVIVSSTSTPTEAPRITGSYLAGSNLTVQGTSQELPGTVIYLYKGGNTLLGTTSVDSYGSWSVGGLTLAGGDVLTAMADAFGKVLSAASQSVTVASSLPSPPVVQGTIQAGQSSISGASGNGTISIYADGLLIGSTTGSSWTLSGINPLDIYKGAEIYATNTVAGVESAPSNIITATGVMSFNISEPDDTSIDNQVAGDPFSIKISAKDEPLGAGNTVTTFGSKVTIASTSFMLTGGGLSPNFSSGILDNHSVSLKTAGANHKITAISSEDPTAFGEAVINVIYPNNTSKFILSGANSTNAGELVMQVVSRFDEFDNPVTGGQKVVYLSAEQGLFKDAASGGRLISQVTIPDGSSTASFWYTHTAAGDYQITASDTQVPNGLVGIDDAVKTITVVGNSTPLLNNSNLADLQTDESAITPTFDPQELSYSANVITTVTSVDITAIPDDSQAEVWINGNYVEGPSYILTNQPLAVGANIFKITVIAENGETKIYTLTITREADPNQDSDLDGVTDNLDQCPNTPANAQVDLNGCANSQKDTDNDGVNDDLDQCPNTPADANVDTHGCANSQKDTDNDGVSDDLDQCPNTPSNATVDGNGCADSQKDSDEDGVTDDLDQCANTPANASVDGNGCADSQKDSDGDLVTDDLDLCPNTPVCTPVDSNGCADSQKDSDNDGVTDDLDQCPNTPANSEVDETGCLQISLATVSTVSQSDVTATSATLNGNVTADGGASVTARGFVYSTSDNTPEIGETGVIDLPAGSGTGSFNEAITGLTASTTYYFRAYAVNSEGTSYGGVESFTTLAGNQAPTDITLDNLTIGDNVPVNSTVGSFSTTDSDTEDTFTYTLVAGTGDADNGVFSISGDELIITESPDSDIKSSYTVRIRTTDSGNEFFEKSFIITVIDVTDPVISVPADVVRNMDEDECSYIVQGMEFDPVSATDDSGVPPSLSYIIKRNLPNPNLVSENFNSGSWDVNNFEIGSPTGSVVNRGYQSADNDDRGTLRTVADFQPTLLNPLHVTATLSFPSGDAIAFIGSRSDGLKNPSASNEPTNGLYFRIHNFIDGYTGISDTSFDGRPGDSFYSNPVIISFVDNGENITGTFTNTVTNQVLNFNENTNFNSGSWKVVFSGSGARWDDIKISLGDHEYPQQVASGTNSLAGLALLNGENTITWTAEDASGNTKSDSLVVTIEDNQNPFLTPPGNLTGESESDVNWETTVGDAVFGDNCSDSILSWQMTGASSGSGTGQVGSYSFAPGITTITYTVTDASGNTVSSDITVENTKNLYAGGSGTELDPYQIEDWEHLYNVRVNLSAHFVLNNDLDETSSGYETFASATANSGEGWLPIEVEESGFSGVFDGGTHVLKGLNINRTSSVWTVGLFAIFNEGAVVKNLGIIDATVVGGGNVGILVGSAYSGQIEKVYSSGSVSSTSSYVRVGGLVGTLGSEAVILRSYSTASVSGTTPTGNTIVGGLVGSCSGSIFNSYSMGSVFGSALSSNYVIIGGLVGYAGNIIENSYSVGAVSSSIETGDLYQGGLIGLLSEGSVISSYYDYQTSGQEDTGNGDPKTTAEMKTQSTFINWDFVNETDNGTEEIWKLSSTENDGYPNHNLNAEQEPPIVTDENISISGATGTAGAFKIGDTVTATWDNTIDGDNNITTISAVTVDFSQFGGGSAVAATNTSGIWTATYTITAGIIDASNRNISVTATDNLDNSTTTADTSDATVDNIPPLVSSFSPENNTTEVALMPTLIITFDQEVNLGNAGIFKLGKAGLEACTIEYFKEYDLSNPTDKSAFVLSEDRLSISLEIEENLPTNTQVLVEIPEGFVVDLKGNSFSGFSAATYTWFFTTINQNEQTITFGEIEEKTYGDATFTLGNAETDRGLTVIYTATDPSVVSITGNQATILKAGSTTITATQDGDELNFPAVPVERMLTVNKATLMVTADANQSKVYGQVDPTFTYTVTGFENEEDEEILTGTLARATGENIGTYAINQGSLSAGDNYEIDFTGANFAITKKTLTITANANQSKVYGANDPTFTYSSTGFENEEDEEILTGTLARATGESTGTYAINQGGLSAGDNYEIDFTGANFAITKKTLTVTTNANQSKVYGQVDPTFTYTVTGFENEEDEEILTGTLARATGENIGTYEINQGSLTGGNNYTIDFNGANFAITTKTLTITANDDNKAYGTTYTFAGTEFTVEGLKDGDEVTSATLTSTGAPASAVVNTYDILISEAQGNGLSNYEITYEDGILTVDRKEVTITADDKQKTYGETNPALTFTYSGLVNGDTKVATEPSISTTVTQSSNVGNYPITLEGGSDDNYEITVVNGTLTIGKKAVTITADDKSKTYGEANPALTFTYTGLTNGDTKVATEPNISTNATVSSNVGTYPITLSGGEDQNYEITLVNGTLTIGKKTLTITADDKQKTYGEANPTLTFTYSGLTNGDTKVATEPSISSTATQSSNVGTYPITLSGGEDQNYAITLVNGTLTIGKKALTITADVKQKIYGEANPTLTFTYAGLTNGDTKVATEPSISTTATQSSNVGTYPITLSGGGDQNYEITLVNGTLTIGKKALTITADDKQKIYGEANPALTFTYSGLVNGDTKVNTEPSISTTATQSSNVGTYPITLEGGSDQNYEITLVNGTLTIGKKALTITADDKQKIYGEANPDLTFSYSGLVNGDMKVNTEPSISTIATQSSNVGTYPITLEGGADQNYEITLVNGKLTIGKKALTITADDKQKTYGEANPTLTFTYSGLVNGDTKVASEPGISTIATMSSFVGTYPITLIGGADQNYEILLVNGALTIGKAVLQIQANPQTKIFGSMDPALTYVATGFKGTDNLSSLSGKLEREAGELVGNYAIGLGTLTATNNYLIEFTSAQFEILPAVLIAISNPDRITTPWSIMPVLPAKLNIVTADGQVVQVPVVWSLANLNLFKRGTYFLSGTLTLPSGILNPENLKPTLEVVVLPKAAPIDVVLSNDDFDPDPKNFFQVIGNFTVIDPIDNVHIISLKPGAGDNQYFEVKQGILFWSSAEEVSGKTQFTVVILVEDRDGNVIEKSFTVNRGRTDILDLEVFNTFTPDGDGINDTWGVPDLRYFTGVRVQVFDRNGERIFYTEDADTRWDGTYKGKEMPVGSYFWVVEVIETGNVRRGILTLLRK